MRITAEDEHKTLIRQAPRVDKNLVSSVSTAIDQLNRGLIQCSEGLCIVYSSSLQANFLLFRQERDDEVADAGFASLCGAGGSPARRAALSHVAPPGSHVAAPMSPSPPLSQVPSRANLLTHNGNAQVLASPRLPARCISFESPTRPASQRPTAAPQPDTPVATPTNADAVLTPTSRASFARMDDNACMKVMPSIPGSPVVQSRSTAKLMTVRDFASSQATAPMVPSLSTKNTAVLKSPDARQDCSSFLTPRSSKITSTSPIAANMRRSLTLSPTARRCFQHGSGSPLNACIAALAEEPQKELGSAKKELSGESFDIGGRRFNFLDVLGRGAFGVVWRAREQDSEEDIAVKVINSTDSASFAVATFEAELLQMLSVACSRMADQVPRYIAHQAARKQDPSTGGVVRLAMSYVPGGAFDRWIYGISDEDHKTVDISELIDGHFPGGQQGLWDMPSACGVVRELLGQLSRVFSALQPIAYHRDVSAHNVLLDMPSGGDLPKFALIDFGLAVRSGTWSQKWRSSNLAGDPRYWTPAAWMAFAFGFKYVTTYPNSGFQQQYLTRMDHFSLGVMGLEALCALCSKSEVSKPSSPGMREVRSAWALYWSAIVNLFQMFHCRGPQEVRSFLGQAREGGMGDLVAHLRTLRQALRQAAVQPANAHCAALLLVLADLVDERGSVSWAEVPGMLSEDTQAVLISQ